MKKSFYSIFAMSMLAVAVTFSSCKKEEEVVDDSVVGRTVNYTVLVTSGGSASTKSIQGLDGATVTVSVNGEVKSVETASDGQATFQDLVSGVAAVTVQANGHTTLNYLVDLFPNNGGFGSTDTLQYDASFMRNASTLVTLFPVSGSGAATIMGKAIAPLNLNNTTDEYAPTGTKLTASITSNLAAYNDHSGDGKVYDFVYEGIMTSTTVDATGSYSLTVPATGDGLQVTVYGDDFESAWTNVGGTAMDPDIFWMNPVTFSVISGTTTYQNLGYN